MSFRIVKVYLYRTVYVSVRSRFVHAFSDNGRNRMPLIAWPVNRVTVAVLIIWNQWHQLWKLRNNMIHHERAQNSPADHLLNKHIKPSKASTTTGLTIFHETKPFYTQRHKNICNVTTSARFSIGYPLTFPFFKPVPHNDKTQGHHHSTLGTSQHTFHPPITLHPYLHYVG